MRVFFLSLILMSSVSLCAQDFESIRDRVVSDLDFNEFEPYSEEILEAIKNDVSAGDMPPLIRIQSVPYPQPDPGQYIVNEYSYKLYRYSSIDIVHNYVVSMWGRSDYWPLAMDNEVDKGNRQGYSLYPAWNLTGEYGLLFNTYNKAAIVRPDGSVVEYLGRPGEFHVGETFTPRWNTYDNPYELYFVASWDRVNSLGQNVKNPLLWRLDARDFNNKSPLINFAYIYGEEGSTTDIVNMTIASHSDHLTQSWDVSGRAFHFDVGGYYDSSWNLQGTKEDRARRLIYDFDTNRVIIPTTTTAKLQPYLLGSTRTGEYFLNAWGTIYNSDGTVQRNLNNYMRDDGTPVTGLNGHAGYAFNNGVQCWVYFESARDMIVVYNPVTQEKWDLISHQDIGYQGNHIANTPPQIDNWVLISTYKSTDSSPDHPMLDKMFFVSLETGAIKMIGDCYKFRSGYWTETQANASIINNETIRVSFASNWDGTDNIEAYFYEVPLSEFGGPAPTPTPTPTPLPNETIIIDDIDAELFGSWTLETARPGYYGTGYRHDQNSDKGNKQAVYRFENAFGKYKLQAIWPSDAGGRATSIPYDVLHSTGTTTLYVDQKTTFGEWIDMGVFEFNGAGMIVVDNRGTDGYTFADAFRLEKLPEPTPTPKPEIPVDKDLRTSVSLPWNDLE